MKKTLLLLALFVASPLCAATCVSVATDNFNRAGPALGANWATLNNLAGDDMKIVASLRVTGGTSGSSRAAARWVGAGSFTDDQCSSILITTLSFSTTSYSTGIIARASADTDSGRDFYEVLVLSDSNGPNYTTQVNKVTNGTRAALNSASRAWAVFDRVGLECEGTTIRGTKNGVAFFTVTDSSITTGKPGIAGSNDEVDANATGDDWDGGNLVAGSAPQFKKPIVIGFGFTGFPEIWIWKRRLA